MTESNQRGQQEEAILQLMVEFRNLFLAQQEAVPPPEPMASPPSSRRRARVAAVLLACVAAVALGYIGGVVWERFGALQRLVVSADGRPVAPPPAVVADSTPPATMAAPDTPVPRAPQSTAVAPGAPVVAPGAVVTPGAPAARPQPIAMAQTPAINGYHVQVGAFNVLVYARDMMRQLRARDYSVTLVEAPTGPPHRVWIDGVFDHSAAARMVDRLRSDGFEAVVVRE
ncbi:MAG TPA: SPOR domain-containing protein [bacterium]|nr:SPOR domain-containing protein [bacterium]